MHEMSLAEGIIQLVEDAARADGCNKVKVIWLEIGQLAAVEKEALRFCFDAVTLDLQHGGLDFLGASNAILAVALAGKPTIVRIRQDRWLVDGQTHVDKVEEEFHARAAELGVLVQADLGGHRHEQAGAGFDGVGGFVRHTATRSQTA